MKLNLDCIRDILLQLENLEFDSYTTTSKLSEILNYSSDEIEYSCLKLYEAGYIDAMVIKTMNRFLPGIKSIHDITYDGHEFLSTIRDNNNWKVIKDRAKTIGVFSLKTISQIGVSYINSLINNPNL
ncbi:DUF2513 domain-containing protein [Miniphocaeibacter massiliensis]|uniref:DUF2513 domain-containing protein n=1 Tax=Miniphocaeibacter massiliensis TaxID=2041841 RepID=UPI0013EC5CC0|nr:DUF2513 domain-containing protein [Miniphocaeibacter massiliensis]